MLGALLVAALGIAWFWSRSLHHPSPVVEPELLRVRSFSFANVTAVLFSVAFAGNLLAAVLWMQQVWGYSAIRTGLGVAVGPAMVPVFAAIGQRLSHRFSVGWITAAGCVLFSVGVALMGFRLTLEPSYAAVVLPAMLIGGSGVGLALPTILSAATADLPRGSFGHRQRRGEHEPPDRGRPRDRRVRGRARHARRARCGARLLRPRLAGARRGGAGVRGRRVRHDSPSRGCTRGRAGMSTPCRPAGSVDRAVAELRRSLG